MYCACINAFAANTPLNAATYGEPTFFLHIFAHLTAPCSRNSVLTVRELILIALMDFRPCVSCALLLLFHEEMQSATIHSSPLVIRIDICCLYDCFPSAQKSKQKQSIEISRFCGSHQTKRRIKAFVNNRAVANGFFWCGITVWSWTTALSRSKW